MSLFGLFDGGNMAIGFIFQGSTMTLSSVSNRLEEAFMQEGYQVSAD